MKELLRGIRTMGLCENFDNEIVISLGKCSYRGNLLLTMDVGRTE
jgi:hypothetical protein